MTWRKLKGILQEHPYLIDDAFHMPMKQAMDLQESEGYPSFEEMALRAKRVSTAPASAWVPVDAVIARRQRKKRSISGLWGYPPTKVALVGLCLLLLASYLAFAPSGRALANYVVHAIIRFFDQGFEIALPNQDAVSEAELNIPSTEDVATSYTDYCAFTADTGRVAVRLEDEALSLESIVAYSSQTEYTLTSTYRSKSNLSVTIHQSWDFAVQTVVKKPSEEWWEEILSNGMIIYCLQNSVDDSFMGMMTLEDSSIVLIAEAGIDYRDIIDSLTID